MKKFIALSVMAMFCAAFVGCGEKTTEEKLKDAAGDAKEAGKDAVDALKK